MKSEYQREAELARKADKHEVAALREHVDRLERSVRELRTALDGVRSQCSVLQESIEEERRSNGQFGVGA